MKEILIGGMIGFLIGFIITLLRRSRRKKKQIFCRHQFRAKEWTDINQDPQCIHCKKWLEQILKEQAIFMKADPDGEHFTDRSQDYPKNSIRKFVKM